MLFYHSFGRWQRHLIWNSRTTLWNKYKHFLQSTTWCKPSGQSGFLVTCFQALQAVFAERQLWSPRPWRAVEASMAESPCGEHSALRTTLWIPSEACHQAQFCISYRSHRIFSADFGAVVSGRLSSQGMHEQKVSKSWRELRKPPHPHFFLYNWDRLETVCPVLGNLTFPSFPQLWLSRDSNQHRSSSRTCTLM